MSRELQVSEREVVDVAFELESLQLDSKAGKTLDSAILLWMVVESY